MFFVYVTAYPGANPGVGTAIYCYLKCPQLVLLTPMHAR